MLAAIVGFFEQPPAGVAVLGYLLVAAVALELVVGKRRLGFGKERFPKSHIALAWTLGAILGIHALIGVGHSIVGFLVKR